MSRDITMEDFSISLISLAIMLPVLVLLFQVFLYLKNGMWTSLSAIDMLIYLDCAWAKSPREWLGLWKVLSFVNFTIPISLALVLLGLFAISN